MFREHRMGSVSSHMGVGNKREIDLHLLDDLRIASNWVLPSDDGFEKEYIRLLCTNINQTSSTTR